MKIKNTLLVLLYFALLVPYGITNPQDDRDYFPDTLPVEII